MTLSLLAAYSGYYKDADGVKHYDYPDVWTSFAQDGLTTVFLYAALALAVLLLAVGFLVYWRKREALDSYLKTAIAVAAGFSLAVIVAMLALGFMDMYESGAVFDLVLWPAVVLAICVVLGVCAVYVSPLFGEKAFKVTKIVALSAAGAALVALLVCLGVYLGSGAGEENNELTITVTENALLYVCAAVILAVLLFIAFFFGRADRSGFDSKSISYAAICIALSFALSYLTIFKLPQGGSVTIASLLPLMIYSYMFGVKKGIFAGLVYGLLQAVQDPWIIHPAQFLLDYPIAFAGIGAAGLFARTKKLDKLPQVQFALGAVLAGTLRYLSHILSGVFAFSEYAYDAAGEPMNAWLYSLTYNSFVFADIAIAIAVGVIVFCSPAFVKAARRFRPKAKSETAETPEEE